MPAFPASEGKGGPLMTVASTAQRPTGIASIGLHLPPLAMAVVELATEAVRSYEVKHACYGGTLAVKQAAEWRLSGAAGDQAALVVAADVALYEQGDPSEPTQGEEDIQRDLESRTRISRTDYEKLRD